MCKAKVSEEPDQEFSELCGATPGKYMRMADINIYL